MEKISKNFFKGDEVVDGDELIILANNKECVYHESWGLKPAAIIQNMQFRIVMRAIGLGKLFRVIKDDGKRSD